MLERVKYIYIHTDISTVRVPNLECSSVFSSPINLNELGTGNCKTNVRERERTRGARLRYMDRRVKETRETIY